MTDRSQSSPFKGMYQFSNTDRHQSHSLGITYHKTMMFQTAMKTEWLIAHDIKYHKCYIYITFKVAFIYMSIVTHTHISYSIHCLGLGHETIVCAVCLIMFLWICDMTRLLRGTFHVLVVFAPNLVLCHLACSITILLGTLLTSDT